MHRVADCKSAGRFVTKKATGPALEVDCSGWVDASPADWRTGRFASHKSTGPAVEVNCSTWRAEPAVWLELIVSFEETTSPAKVIECANRMIQIAHELDPGLSLTYDFTRTRPVDNGDVVIVLTPTLQSSADQRIQAVAARIESEMANVPSVKRVQAQLARAA